MQGNNVYEVRVVAPRGRERGKAVQIHDVGVARTPVLFIAINPSAMKIMMCVNFMLLNGVYIGLCCSQISYNFKNGCRVLFIIGYHLRMFNGYFQYAQAVHFESYTIFSHVGFRYLIDSVSIHFIL